MKNFVAAALLSVAPIGGPAFAQSAQPADRVAPTAATSTAAGSKMMLRRQLACIQAHGSRRLQRSQ